MTSRTIQIMPASGWHAKITYIDGTSDIVELVGWALIEHRDDEGDPRERWTTIEGVIQGIEEACTITDAKDLGITLVTYIAPGDAAEAKARLYDPHLKTDIGRVMAVLNSQPDGLTVDRLRHIARMGRERADEIVAMLVNDRRLEWIKLKVKCGKTRLRTVDGVRPINAQNGTTQNKPPSSMAERSNPVTDEAGTACEANAASGEARRAGG